MRSILVALLLGCVIVFAACLRESKIKMPFVNESDSDLCFNLSLADATTFGFCNEVKPRGTTVWRPECGQAGEQPLTVVLTGRPERRQIYNRTATCNEWEESGAKFTIEQRGDELVVTDSLQDATPSP